MVEIPINESDSSSGESLYMVYVVGTMINERHESQATEGRLFTGRLKRQAAPLTLAH